MYNKQYKMRISFIGLGKLGLPLATCFAKNKINVLAIDKNESLINKLKKNICPWIENSLDQNINKASKYIEYTSQYSKIAETEATIILVNTPSDKNTKYFSNQFIKDSLENVCIELKKAKKKNHLFILSSTVMPLSINEELIPLIEKITNFKLNEEFGFVYIPDFVAIGEIINGFENPDFVLIGQSNSNYGGIAENLYRSIIKNNAKINRMNLLEAEVAKISLNTYITTKISFSNFLGLLCKKIDSSINIDKITNCIGQDKRIGNKYLKAGISYGGTCFPRDAQAMIKLAEKFKLNAHQIIANETINEESDEEIIKLINKTRKIKVAILGLSFKNNTSVVEESLAFKIISKAKNKKLKFNCYDISGEAIQNFQKIIKNNNIKYYTDTQTIIDDSEVIILSNNNSEYKKLVFKDKTIIDPWRILTNE